MVTVSCLNLFIFQSSVLICIFTYRVSGVLLWCIANVFVLMKSTENNIYRNMQSVICLVLTVNLLISIYMIEHGISMCWLNYVSSWICFGKYFFFAFVVHQGTSEGYMFTSKTKIDSAIFAKKTIARMANAETLLPEYYLLENTICQNVLIPEIFNLFF